MGHRFGLTLAAALTLLLAGAAEAQQPAAPRGPPKFDIHAPIDPSHRRAVSVTMWESVAAMQASEQRSHEMRTRATHPVDVTIESVGHFEVASIARGGGVVPAA